MSSAPNPLVPQGSLQQASSRSKSNFRIAIFIVVVVHVALISGFLVVGCKREDPNAVDAKKRKEITSTYSPTSDYYPPVTPTPATNPPDPFGGALPPVPSTTPAPTSTAISPGTTPAPVVQPETVMPPAITDEPGAATKEYTIARGDTFYSIAKKFGVSMNAVVKANPGVDPTRLKVGQVIKVPSSNGGASASNGGAGMAAAPSTGNGEVYTVKSGDTLTRIANKYGTTVAALKSANHLRTDRIHAGDKLKIPGAARPTEAAPAGTSTPPAPLPDSSGGVLPPVPGNP